MTHKVYEPDAKLLVLSADSFNEKVSPASHINHVFRTKISRSRPAAGCWSSTMAT